MRWQGVPHVDVLTYGEETHAVAIHRDRVNALFVNTSIMCKYPQM